MPFCPHPPGRQTFLFGANDYITGDHFTVERCEDCGMAFTRPRPDAMQMTKYYPAGYFGGGSKRFPAVIQRLQRSLYARRAKMVERILGRKGRVLDIGCGPGFLLRSFRERGWEVQGTEFTGQSAAHAQNILKLPVLVGDVAELGLGEASFDAVIMWHVLEHVADPEDTIVQVGRLLRPGGVFLCAVPNFGSVEAKITRDKWFHLDVPRHLNHFTLPALLNLLAINGFAVSGQSFIALEYDYFSLTQSVLNRIGLRQNLLFNLLRGAKARVLGEQAAPAWQRIASVVLAAPLGVLSIPSTTLAALFRASATVAIYATKR